jgi:hypothetical protein
VPAGILFEAKRTLHSARRKWGFEDKALRMKELRANRKLQKFCKLD